MKLKYFLRKFTKSLISWQEIERFEPSWKERIAYMAKLIPADARSLADMGAGPSWLKTFLPNHIKEYIPVDYKRRNEETVIRDFNRNEYLEEQVDVSFVSGCLEYINMPELFIEKSARYSKYLILSYCTIDKFADNNFRRKKAWVNDLSNEMLTSILMANGFEILHSSSISNNQIYLCSNLNIR